MKSGLSRKEIDDQMREHRITDSSKYAANSEASDETIISKLKEGLLKAIKGCDVVGRAEYVVALKKRGYSVISEHDSVRLVRDIPKERIYDESSEGEIETYDALPQELIKKYEIAFAQNNFGEIDRLDAKIAELGYRIEIRDGKPVPVLNNPDVALSI